jgi:hypothetical protein
MIVASDSEMAKELTASIDETHRTPRAICSHLIPTLSRSGTKTSYPPPSAEENIDRMLHATIG